MQTNPRLFFSAALTAFAFVAVSLVGCSSERGLDRKYQGEGAAEFFSKVLNEVSQEEAQAVVMYTPGVMMGVLASTINPSAGSFDGMTARAIFQKVIDRDLQSKQKELADLKTKAELQSTVSKIAILALTTNAASVPADQRGGMRNAIQLTASVKNDSGVTISGARYTAQVMLDDEKEPAFSFVDGVSFPRGLPSGEQAEVVSASNWMDRKWEMVAVRNAKKFTLDATVTSYTDDRDRSVTFDSSIQDSVDKAEKDVERLRSYLGALSKRG